MTPQIQRQIREIAAIKGAPLDNETKDKILERMLADLKRMSLDALGQQTLTWTPDPATIPSLPLGKTATLSPGTVEDKGPTVPTAKKA